MTLLRGGSEKTSFYRLSVVLLQIPSLSERPEDVPELVGRFIQHFRAAMPITKVEGISNAAVEALMAYDWPGNVRELINVVERAMLLGRSAEIMLGDLPPTIAQRDPAANLVSSASTSKSDAIPEEWLTLSIKEVRELAVQRAESTYLRAILKNANGHLGDAAKVVGLSARALYQKMKRYDLKKEDFKGS